MENQKINVNQVSIGIRFSMKLPYNNETENVSPVISGIISWHFPGSGGA